MEKHEKAHIFEPVNNNSSLSNIYAQEVGWRKANDLYYQDIESLFGFYILPNASVLEIGSGLGNLLNAVKPKYGIGLDSHILFIEKAKTKFPHLNFAEYKDEFFITSQTYDYVLLANTISYTENLQNLFLNIYQVCHFSTKVLITFHNPGWEFILKFATLIKQRRTTPELNWLNYEDVANLLNLANFEVINHHKRMLLPRRIPILYWIFNKLLAPLPIINQFCLTEYIIARPKFSTVQKYPKNQEATCSVIIPARNEAGNIESCLTQMPQLGKHTEIIFIEGHSRDGTWEEIQRVQAKYCDQWDIKISQQKGKGKGDAVRQGFAMATGDVLIILDSDLTVKPEDLVYFFQAIASGQTEFANGCRLIYPVTSKTMPWLNRMANRFFAWILSYLLHTKIKDSLCGTKALSKENYWRIAKNRSYFGDFDPFGDFDLLFGAAKLGLQLQDIPIRYMPRTYGSSNIQHFKEGIVLLKMCLYAARKIKFR